MVAPEEASDLSRSLVRVPGSGSDRSLTPVTCDLGRVSSLAATVPINPRLPDIITKPRNTPALPKPQPTAEAEATTNKLGSQQGGPMRHARTRPVSAQPYQVKKKTGDQAPQSPTPSPTQGPTATTTPFPAMPPPPTPELPTNLMTNMRARIKYITLQEAMRCAPNIMHVNTSAGPVLFMSVHTEGTKLPRTRLVTQPPMQARPAGERGSAGQEASTGQQRSGLEASTGQQRSGLEASTGQQRSGLEASTGQQRSEMTVMTLEQLMRQQNSLRLENAELHQQVSRFRQLFQNPDRLVAVMRRLGIRVDPN